MRRSRKKGRKAVKKTIIDDEENFNRLIPEALAHSGTKESKNNKDNTVSMNYRTLILAVLGVNTKALDSTVELRRMFGSKVVDHKEKPSRGRATAVRNRAGNGLGRKNILGSPHDDWPLVFRDLLELKPVYKDDPNVYIPPDPLGSDIQSFKFNHPPAYQTVQQAFFSYAVSMDIQGIQSIIYTLDPYHVDTLLLMSDVMKSQGSLSESADLVERALYSLGRALSPAFTSNIGHSRLPFCWFENRSFYLAISRHMGNLGRKGCWATMFEFSKLLYSLSPGDDPYGALLVMDHLAIRSKDYSYISSLIAYFNEIGDAIPANILFSHAIAIFLDEKRTKDTNHTNGFKALNKVIVQYPWFVDDIFNELGISSSFNSSPLCNTQQFYTAIYKFWNKSILEKNSIKSLFRLYIQQGKTTEHKNHLIKDDTIPLNHMRHVVVFEIPNLWQFIQVDSYHSFDPLPPTPSWSLYDRIDEPELNSNLNLSGGNNLSDLEDSSISGHESEIEHEPEPEPGIFSRLLRNFTGLGR